MKNRALIRAAVFGFVLGGTLVSAQDVGRYREFELGSDVAAVSTVTGVALSELKAIHERPAVIQELAWRTQYGARRTAVSDGESVEQIVFDFYDHRLFRMTVGYDPNQTHGLTDTDLIEAISVTYRSPLKPLASRRGQASAIYDDARTRIAQWGGEGNSVVLYRLSSYAPSFTLVVTDESMAARTRTAAARAVLLDAREAPQREAAALAKKEADDRRVAEQKARLTNKAIFRS
jgi:hypothetical protein